MSKSSLVVDNALKYGPRQSTIDCRCAGDLAGGARLLTGHQLMQPAESSNVRDLAFNAAASVFTQGPSKCRNSRKQPNVYELHFCRGHAQRGPYWRKKD